MGEDVKLILALLITTIFAYLCGCLNGAAIVSKYILRDDIRAHGSGNAGLTNFHRTFGGKLTAVVLLLDVVKMVVALWGGVLILREPIRPVFELIGGSVRPGWIESIQYWSGLWCLLGHMFPVTFGFKGGKGVLSGVTLMFCLDWRMGLIAIAIFLVVVALTRYVSLGSCLAAVSFPVSTCLFVSRAPVFLVVSIGLAALVIFMHRGNLVRVVKGEERRFSLHREKKE